MRYDPDRHHRRSIRLRGFDYTSNTTYFVTICVLDRAPLLGSIVEGQFLPSEAGLIVEAEWERSAELRREIDLGPFTLMPNHVHGLVTITPQSDGAASEEMRSTTHLMQRPSGSLGSLVAGFKRATTKRINGLNGVLGAPFWQRNYYEHIVRNEGEAERISTYILTNVAAWESDTENPNRLM